MDVESSVNKLLNPVEKYSTWIGVGLDALKPNVLSGLESSISNIINGGLHTPEVNNIINYAIANDISPAILAVLGEAMAGMGNRTIANLGKITTKIATGYIILDLIQNILYYSTHSDGSVGNTSVNYLPQQAGGYTSRPLQGSTLNQSGQQNLSQNYQSVYPNNPSAGTIYTVASGGRLMGN